MITPAARSHRAITHAIHALLTGLLSALLAYEATGSIAAGDSLWWPRG